jgi:hypothetical protein
MCNLHARVLAIARAIRLRSFDGRDYPSLLHVGLLLEHLKAPRDAIIRAYLGSHACRPTRAEMRKLLANEDAA